MRIYATAFALNMKVPASYETRATDVRANMTTPYKYTGIVYDFDKVLHIYMRIYAFIYRYMFMWYAGTQIELLRNVSRLIFLQIVGLINQND